MADLRMKLFVLAGMATVFAGMASAQTACTTATANAVFVRSESNDDQVADTTLTCQTAGGTAAGTISMTVYLSPSVNITSFNVGTSSSPKSEAIAGLTAGFVAGGGAPWVSGSVSGNSVTFSNITTAACAAGPACAAFTVTITNIKIASSTVATGTGVPTGVSETIFVSGTNTTPSAITTGSAVAYVTSGLNGIKSSGTSSNPLCNATNTWNTVAGVLTASVPNFTVTFAEAFPNSFKVQGSTAANNALGLWYTNHSETGTGVTAYTTPNTATSGTRIKLIFNNVPANVTLYVPITFGGAAGLPNTASAATNSAVLTLTASETGALSPVAGSAATGAPGSTSTSTNNGGITTGNSSAAPLTVTSGTATAIYEVTTVSTAPGTFAIPVYIQAAAGAVAAPTSAITATVSFAPIGATSNVPNFINGASTTTVNGSTFAACSTTLMFPFVTNVAGFETGMAISNTGADLLATKSGAPVSSVTGQTGTCLLTFFSSATASSNPAAFTTPSIVPGTTWASTLTSVTGGIAGSIADGYTIAQCNFLFAHGYAFIVYNVGQSSAMAEGYLALALTTGRAATSGGPEAANN
jgi:hypothetical protein